MQKKPNKKQPFLRGWVIGMESSKSAKKSKKDA